MFGEDHYLSRNDQNRKAGSKYQVRAGYDMKLAETGKNILENEERHRSPHFRS